MAKKGNVMVTRFQRVLQCINETKGIADKIEESRGVMIHNWSPNNVRRLFLGPDFVGIQKYVSAGTKNKFELYKIERVDDSKPCSVLKLLTAGRVLSSIEEIIIFQEAGKVYYDVEGVWGNTSFVRLGIFMVYEGGAQAFVKPPEYLKISSENLEYRASFHRMFSHEFKNYGFTKMMGFKPNYSMINSSKSFLRPIYYSLDSDALKNYFVKLAGKEKEFNDAVKSDLLGVQKLERTYVDLLRVMASKGAEKYYATITPYLIEIEGIGEYVPYMTIPIGCGGIDAVCKAVDGVISDEKYDCAFVKKWDNLLLSDKLLYFKRQIQVLYSAFGKSIESFLVITYSKDSKLVLSELRETWMGLEKEIERVDLGMRLQDAVVILVDALSKMRSIVYPNC